MNKLKKLNFLTLLLLAYSLGTQRRSVNLSIALKTVVATMNTYLPKTVSWSFVDLLLPPPKHFHGVFRSEDHPLHLQSYFRRWKENHVLEQKDVQRIMANAERMFEQCFRNYGDREDEGGLERNLTEKNNRRQRMTRLFWLLCQINFAVLPFYPTLAGVSLHTPCDEEAKQKQKTIKQETLSSKQVVDLFGHYLSNFTSLY